MSHVTALKGLVMQDEAAIITTINELIANGLHAEIRRNSSVRGHTSSDVQQMGKCEIVMHLKGTTYDVGFKRNAKGEFEPVFDIYGEKVGSQLGISREHAKACELPSDYFQNSALQQLGKFSQLYAKNAAMNQAAAEGYTVDSIIMDEKTGEMQILLNV